MSCASSVEIEDVSHKAPCRIHVPNHRDFAFNIRIGGNLYIRGGDRIDSGDPGGVPPRVGRQSVKRFLKGAGTDILNQGQQKEDAAASSARARGQADNWK